MLVDFLKDLMLGPLHCCGCGCYVGVDHVLAIMVKDMFLNPYKIQKSEKFIFRLNAL